MDTVGLEADGLMWEDFEGVTPGKYCEERVVQEKDKGSCRDRKLLMWAKQLDEGRGLIS